LFNFLLPFFHDILIFFLKIPFLVDKPFQNSPLLLFQKKINHHFLKNYNMRKYFLLFVLIICLQNMLQAQTRFLQTPCATTAQGTAGNFTISYTIGEMPIIDSWKSNSLFVTNGIVQPELPKLQAEGNAFADGEINIFPNPTPGNLFLQYNLGVQGILSLQLYDAIGQRLLTDEITINSFSTKKYDLAKYASAAYILKIQFESTDGTVVKKGKYKIVKAT
jgi:Secretion system C-terminal sorting domain